MSRTKRREGSMAVMMAIGLMLSLFIGGLAVDIGYLMLTKTQLQAAADAAALAGGTELLPGVGKFAYKTPEQVAAAAAPAAVQFAAANRSGNLPSAYLDPQRDVAFGKAVFDRDSGTWQRTWGATPYNMVGATLHRDQQGSGSGDGPLPLFFARAMGRQTHDVIAAATAVILPAKGFKVDDGGDTANIMPFAYREIYWKRLQAAQDWYDDHGHIPDYGDADYPMWFDGTQDVPMFGHLEPGKNKNSPPTYVQDIFDNFRYNAATGAVSGSLNNPSPDGWLDVNVYPRDWHNLVAGNAGTVDLGDTNNATPDLMRQIIYGLSASDFASMEQQGLLDENGGFVLDPTADPPVTVDVNGDTGLSVAIKAALEQILGQPKAIALFNDVWGGGNNAYFTLTEFVGVRVMDVALTGNNKAVWMQMAPFVDGTAVADIDSEIGEDTTVFSPLILID